jgi:F-type H+-transporting ATPase subunit a
LKKIPDKKQSALEILIETINGLVKDNMGEAFKGFVPYIGTLVIYLLVMNLTPLIAVEAPTKDYSVALGMAVITFFVIQGYTIKKVGLLHYFTGFAKPFPVLLPMNVIERVMLPVSLSLRLFGNITAGTFIMGLAYTALSKLTPIAQLGIPVPLHFYFDLFDGAVQMLIFTMLTMINIKIISEH